MREESFGRLREEKSVKPDKKKRKEGKNIIKPRVFLRGRVGYRISGVNPNPRKVETSIPNPNPRELGSDRIKPDFRVFQFQRVFVAGSGRVVGFYSGFGLFVHP